MVSSLLWRGLVYAVFGYWLPEQSGTDLIKGTGPYRLLLHLFFLVLLSVIKLSMVRILVISLSKITTFHELNAVLLQLSQRTNGLKVHQALMGKAQHW